MKCSKFFLLIIILGILVFSGCSKKEKSKFEGAWQQDMQGLFRGESSTFHLIFLDNNWIMLSNGFEVFRGTFTTDYKVNIENTYLNLHGQYRTIYQEDYAPFVEEYSGDDEYSYHFDSNGSLIIAGFGDFIKATIPSEEMEKIKNVFQENCNNIDMRNTVLYEGQIYSTLFRLYDIREIIEQGTFENVITEKETKNGTFENNTLFWTDRGLFIDALPLRNITNGILKKGDDISIALLNGSMRVEIEKYWNKAIYVGTDTTFNSMNSQRYAYLNHRIYCKLYFNNGNPIIEVISIVTSDYI